MIGFNIEQKKKCITIISQFYIKTTISLMKNKVNNIKTIEFRDIYLS